MFKDILLKYFIAMVPKIITPSCEIVPGAKNDSGKTNKYYTSKMSYTVTYIHELCCEHRIMKKYCVLVHFFEENNFKTNFDHLFIEKLL